MCVGSRCVATAAATVGGIYGGVGLGAEIIDVRFTPYTYGIYW